MTRRIARQRRRAWQRFWADFDTADFLIALLSTNVIISSIVLLAAYWFAQ